MDYSGQEKCMRILTTVLLPLLLLFGGHTVRAIPLKGTPPSSEYRLLHDLTYMYDPHVRPRYNSSDVVNINVRFSLQQIYDLDEKRQILTISGWITAEWEDEFLVWDPDEYDGLQTIMVSPKKIWTPKLAIGNSATRMFHEWKHFWLTVRYNGKCRWQPGGNFAYTCALDMNFYPFDEQSCTMEIETWFYTADKVQLTKTKDEFGLETYLQHGEWTVIRTEVTQTDRVYGYYKNEAFPELYFTIHLRRKYTFYFMYIFLPCIMLSFVLLMVFLLPAESGEKISLGVSILVAFSLFLLIVAEQVPDTSDAVPIIAIYLMYFMMATALSVMTSTFVLKLHHHGLDNPPSQWLRSFMFDTLAPLMRLRNVSRWSRLHRQCDHYAKDRLNNQPKESIVHINGSCSYNGCNGFEQVRTLDSGEVRTLSRTLSLECLRMPSEGGERSTVFRRSLGVRHTSASGALGKTDNVICDIPQGTYKSEEWRKISVVMDRMFFWLFLFFILLPLVSLVGFVHMFSID